MRLLSSMLALMVMSSGALMAQPAAGRSSLANSSLRIQKEAIPYFKDAWRPTATSVLATLDGRPLDESDLLVHLLLEEKDPLILKNWQSASSGRAPAQHRALREAILSRAQLRLLADRAAKESAPSEELVAKGARLRAYPAATMVYADLIARPSVDVTPLDVAYSYEQSGSTYRKPDAYVVRELRVPIAQPANEAARRDARRRANELRDRALSGEGLVPLLREYPQYRLIQDVEGTTRLEVGTAALGPLVQEQLATLAVGQISQPVPTSGAFSIYEVVRAERAQTTPVGDVQGDIRANLRQQILEVRTDSLIREMVREKYPIVYTDVFPYAEDESVIMRIGSFTATYGEILSVFPELPTEPLPTQNEYDVPEGVGDFLSKLRNGELMTQEIERAQLTREYTYQAGLRVARDRVLADIYRTQMMADVVLTDEEIYRWIATNRDSLAPAERRGIWEVSIIPENWNDLPLEQQRALDGEMRGILTEVVRIGEQLISERAAISGPRVYREPVVIVSRLLRNDPGRYRMTIAPMGLKTQQEAVSDLGIDVSVIEEGRFGGVEDRRNGVLTATYVGGVVEQDTPMDEQLLEFVRPQIERERAFASVAEEFAELESSGRLQFLLPTD